MCEAGRGSRRASRSRVTATPSCAARAATSSIASGSPSSRTHNSAVAAAVPAGLAGEAVKNVAVHARIQIGKESEEKALYFKPGGKRLSVGRATDCDLSLTHPSVSKIHAAILMNREGTLLVSDTGSVNGTYINGRRINYGEARQLEDGDVVGFGDVEVRFRKQ